MLVDLVEWQVIDIQLILGPKSMKTERVTIIELDFNTKYLFLHCRVDQERL